MAAIQDNIDMVRCLISHKADIKIKDKDGKTPLDLTEKAITRRLVNLLLTLATAAIPKNHDDNLSPAVIDPSESDTKPKIPTEFTLAKAIIGNAGGLLVTASPPPAKAASNISSSSPLVVSSRAPTKPGNSSR